MKILMYDLENVMEAEHIFHPGKQSRIGGRKAGFCGDLAYILNFGFKWLDGNGGVVVPNKEKFKSVPHDIKEIDREIVLEALDLISQADVVVTWYGSGHDVKFLRARAAQYGLVYPDQVQHIDLWKTYARKFPMSSNRLEAAADFLGIGMNKIDIDKINWARCWFGDMKALKTMADYCYQDVVVLEAVYKKLLPNIDQHPNKAVSLGLDPKTCCPNCGSSRTIMRGLSYTNTTKFKRRSCQDCGRWFKGERVI